MVKSPLFSTYRQGENHVTSSMLAVFERIDLALLEGLLARATGEASLQLVSFVNQPTGTGQSVPDARISARFAYWFEVKTARKALNAAQLVKHQFESSLELVSHGNQKAKGGQVARSHARVLPTRSGDADSASHGVHRPRA